MTCPLDLVHFQCVALVAINRVPLTAFLPAILFGGYKLCNPGKSICERRYLVAETDKKVPRLNSIATITDRHGRRITAADQFVRNKAAVTEGPQQLIESFGVRLTHRMNVDRILQPPSLFGQLASKGVTRMFVDLVENVKVDLSHVNLG